jgi:hypothetical protein
MFFQELSASDVERIKERTLVASIMEISNRSQPYRQRLLGPKKDEFTARFYVLTRIT